MIRTTRLAVAAAAGVAFILPVALSAAPAQAAPGDPLTLNIFHMNDSHSKLDPGSGSVDLGTSGGEFDYELGGWPRVQTMFENLRTEHAGENNVSIHAGDAITGTLYYTLFGGEAEAAMMNHTCFDIFEVGNHEFDSGDAGLAEFLDYLNEPTATCPDGTDVLGANVIPAPGTPLNPDADPSVTTDDYLKPYVVKTFDGDERVGFIGIDIAEKTKNSSSPLDTTEFLDEVETTQHYVDLLQADGVENIVLVSHYQYDNDIALAQMVEGVDAIIGGDSHSLLGDFGEFAPETDGPYPTMTTNLDGDPVCVVQAFQYSAVVGELELEFDGTGKLSGPCGGSPHMLVGDFTRDNVDGDPTPITGAELTEIDAIIDGLPAVDHVEGDPEAQALLDTFSAEVDELAAQIIGTTAEPICLNRLPGDTRSAGICATDQVAASGARADVNGGFMQQIVTDAFLARSFEADIALQNAGGVRIALPAGDISIADAYEVLPFSNTLVNMDLTGAEVVQTLEDAAANFVDNPGGSNGSYPYGSAIRWDADLSQPAGERFTNVEVRNAEGVWGPIDLAATYTVVTNSFIASGQDGYTTFGEVFDDPERVVVDTGIDYAQAFIDWITEDAEGVVTIPPASEFSTQTFVGADGELFAPAGPIRMLDTRAKDRTVGTTFDGEFENTGFMTPGKTLELQIGGRGVVPPTATAVALNVTATETAGAGYITAWPCDVAQPAASTVNYLFPGVTVANSIIVPVGEDGKVCLETTVAGAHVVVDLTGWSANSDGLDPLTPARLIDTRAVDADGNGKTIDNVSSAIGILRPGAPVTLQVAGRGGVPAEAVAVAINLAVIGNTAPGFVTAWPCDTDRPLASSLNYTGNTAVANSVIVPLSATGTLCLEADVSNTHLVGDVTAAFAESDEFGGIVPTRFLDTRAATVDLGHTFDDIGEGTGILQPGVAYELQITGRGPTPEGAAEGEGIVPSNASLISINLAVTDTQGPGFLTVWPCDEDRPIASSINYSTVGVTIANSILVPISGDGTVCIGSDVSAAHAVADVTAYIL